MTPDKIAALEALLAEMTPGEYRVRGDTIEAVEQCNNGSRTHRLVVRGPSSDSWIAPEQTRRNVDGLAKLKNAAPALIATIREQGEEMERLRRAIKQLASYAATARTVNQDEWMRGLIEELNDAAEVAGEWRHFVLAGSRRDLTAEYRSPNPQPDAKGE